MEHLSENKSIKTKKANDTIEEKIWLTNRDLAIISYVCEMKFAGLEDLHFKFFKNLKNGNESNSLWWARERLSALEKDGFLERKYAFDERVSYYLGTLKGYKTLQLRSTEALAVRPVDKINHNTFNHDKMVIEVRNKLEAMGKVKQWHSDRKLFCFPELNQHVDKWNQPDGIFITPGGEVVALEVEISRKTNEHYREKIKAYVGIVRKQEVLPTSIKKILYVTGNVSTHNAIKTEVKLYQQYFTLMTIEEFREKYEASKTSERVAM